jgi:hypothetical protein
VSSSGRSSSLAVAAPGGVVTYHKIANMSAVPIPGGFRATWDPSDPAEAVIEYHFYASERLSQGPDVYGPSILVYADSGVPTYDNRLTADISVPRKAHWKITYTAAHLE